MVKVDVKRDYYADLELPPTADAEEVKRQFRLLAKQYHPDRNPGHETEAIPKFQAIQAAHEVLSDPQEKAKYDAARAKLARPAAHASTAYPGDPFNFQKPGPTRFGATSVNFAYAPPPKAKPRPPTQTTFATPKPRQQPPSVGAEKLNAFTRAVPQQSWDRARFEETRAETARAFPAMRPSQPSAQVPPPRQHPTAPKPSVNVPSPDVPHVPNGLHTGFPGLSRTASTRKYPFVPAEPGNDEPMAPLRTSAYAYVRGDRSHASDVHMHASDYHSVHSPPMAKSRPTASPLRHTKSSDQDIRTERPSPEHPWSRYAGTTGEKTDIHGAGLGRSATGRHSPVDQRWQERGQFGRPYSHYGPPPRHRSASPKLRRSGTAQVDFSSSESSSSSEEEPLSMGSRPKATPHRSGPKADGNGKGPSHRPFSDDNPALTGQFPSTNYTKVVDDRHPYTYPAPGARDGPVRRPFPDMISPDELSKSDGRSGFRYVHRDYVQGANVTSPGNLKHSASAPESSREGISTTFSAADWQSKFDTAENIFHPGDSSQVRKSPSKSSRTTTRPTARTRAEFRGLDQQAQAASEAFNAAFNPEATEPVEKAEAQPETAASQPGEDWTARLGNAGAGSKPPDTGNNIPNSSSDPAGPLGAEPDAMDVDETTLSGNGPPNLSSNTIHRRSTGPAHTRRASTDGVSLKDFSSHAPFAPSMAGLQDLDDLSTTLPFESRPSGNLNLKQKTSTKIRDLNLPKPPKPVVPPAIDKLTRDNWNQYVANMNTYMHEWDTFDKRMIDHFGSRQEQVSRSMSKNWVAMVGDGPDADEINAADPVPRAGYAAYMTWLKDDTKCLEWWGRAWELHRQCLEDLGKMREKVKAGLR